MPTSDRPRKTYRPRPLRVPPIIRYSEADEVRLQLVPHVDLERFRNGSADGEAWSTLATRVNWGAVLANRHHPAATALMAEAARSLASIHARHARTGQWGTSGPEFTALADALVVIDDMQRACTRVELHSALQVVLREQARPTKLGQTMEVDA